MLSYHNPQINTTRPNSSQSPQNKSKDRECKVIFRTQEHLDYLKQLGFKLLISPTTNKNKAAFAILKIIVWDCINKGKGSCDLSQDKIGELANWYGYKSGIKERQVRRNVAKLVEAGLITSRRKNYYQEKSVNLYQTTELGFDMYNFVVQDNNYLVQLKAIELSTSPVDKYFPELKVTPKNQKSDLLVELPNPNDSVGLEEENRKSDLYLKDIPYKKDLNLNINTRTIIDKIILAYDEEMLRSTPKEESFYMTDPYQRHEFTSEQDLIVKEIINSSNVSLNDENIFRDEIVIALQDHQRRGINVIDFRYFANCVKELTWRKYYWDCRDSKKEGTH